MPRIIETILLILILVVTVTTSDLYAFQKQSLPIGATIPMAEQKMQDVSGRGISLNEVAQENGLIVIFSCNTCPWIMKWEDRYAEISSIARENRIGLIALNPNEDYRGRGDGMDDMIKRAQKAGYNFPYVMDKDHLVADSFGAERTPEIFLFNGNLELVFKGAIDDNPNDATSVKNHYLRNAIDQLMTSQEIELPSTKISGCTIKRTG